MLHDTAVPNPHISPGQVEFAAEQANDPNISLAEAIVDFGYLITAQVADRHVDVVTAGSAWRKARKAIGFFPA